LITASINKSGDYSVTCCNCAQATDKTERKSTDKLGTCQSVVAFETNLESNLRRTLRQIVSSTETMALDLTQWDRL